MTIIRIPDDKVWAFNGDNTEPTAVRFEEGNISGVAALPPKDSDHNFQMNRNDNNQQAIMREGILPWDAVEVFPLDGICKYQGQLYISLVAGNQNSVPTGANWEALTGTGKGPTLDSSFPEDSTDSESVFTVVVDESDGHLQYQWYQDGSVIIGENSTTYTPVASNPGSYSIECRASDDGGVTYSRVADWSWSSHFSPPTMSQTQPADVDTARSGTPFTITAIITDNGGEAASYQWYREGVIMPGETLLSATITEPLAGSYEYFCRATNSAGFGDSRTATVLVDEPTNILTVGNDGSEYGYVSSSFGELTPPVFVASSGSATITSITAVGDTVSFTRDSGTSIQTVNFEFFEHDDVVTSASFGFGETETEVTDAGLAAYIIANDGLDVPIINNR